MSQLEVTKNQLGIKSHRPILLMTLPSHQDNYLELWSDLTPLLPESPEDILNVFLPWFIENGLKIDTKMIKYNGVNGAPVIKLSDNSFVIVGEERLSFEPEENYAYGFFFGYKNNLGSMRALVSTDLDFLVRKIKSLADEDNVTLCMISDSESSRNAVALRNDKAEIIGLIYSKIKQNHWLET